MGKDAETITLANEKTRELARPAFRRRLYNQIELLKVSLDDVGGRDALRGTVDIRDSLIHSAGEVQIEAILREKKRLETVFERVLLSILNWRDPTNDELDQQAAALLRLESIRKSMCHRVPHHRSRLLRRDRALTSRD